MSETDNSKPSEKQEVTIEDEWLIRPCVYYEGEYSDCISIRARFHQYFIFGKPIDCIQWKKDSDNCCKWVEKKDIKAGNELVRSEKARRKERLTPHYTNNVWQKRKAPPENWNAPLPQHITEGYEQSYLNIKSKEMRGEIPPTIDSSYCVIM